MKTPADWLNLADDTRGLADRMHDPGAKQTLLTIARGYEKLARRAALAMETNLPIDDDETEALKLRGRSSANPKRADRT
jgi:hypothetical protein